jgi:putative ABC transport system substrate-binding protein
MRRREFISFLAGTVAGWPLTARAQQPAMLVMGYLYIGSPEASATDVAGFRQGLAEAGLVEGRNVRIEYRTAQNDAGRLPELAADLVRRGVALIAAVDSPSALAAMAATATIPIVFETGADPVQLGFVVSLNRPGGNITGVTSMNAELAAKRIGLLRELLPQATRYAVLVNPANAALSERTIKYAQTATTAIGCELEVFSASSNREIDAAFVSMVQKRVDALLINPDVLFNNRRVQLATLAIRHGVPAMHDKRVFVEAGGLISYGANIADIYRQVGVYAGRILKGEKPGDLPVLQPTKFDLVINLQTARTIGVEIPTTLSASADEVIE